MTPPDDLREPVTALRPSTAYVWDLPTRLFHWLLVLSVTIGFLTGFIAPEWWMGVHKWAGYAVAGLVLFRLVWGLFGSEYSRFGSMAGATRHLGDHVRGLLMLRPPHFLGHNPLGVLMILALAVVLIGLTATGLFVLGGEEKQGPLAGIADYAIGNSAKTIHWLLALALLAMIAGHLAGVIGESLLQRENLVRAMITGRKHLPPDVRVPKFHGGYPLAATATMTVIAGPLAVLLSHLATLPPVGSRVLAGDPAYQDECGACHDAFHPSLLPADSWRQIMAGLDDHFGEDASLDPATAQSIAQWLSANAAETWDSEAANRFRILAAGQPLRITTTPYWVAKHEEVPVAAFQRKSVGSKVNCVACHGDAGTGLFDDDAISIPKE
jgi:cytochrome b